MTTVLQRVDLPDRITITSAAGLRVTGFRGDTLVRDALERLAAAAGVAPAWRVHLEKRIPVAAGLGGGSSDAATALRVVNRLLPRPLDPTDLVATARAVGVDVPFFLQHGPQLGEGDGAELTPLDVPQDFWVLLVLPRGEAKASTAAVYARFDERDGAAAYEERRRVLLQALADVRRARDLERLPPNDLAQSPLAEELRRLGAYRADVSGAGPTVYGLFSNRRTAEAARRAVSGRGRTWLTVPAWYG